MLKFLKKNKLITFMSLTLMATLSAVVVSTVAWFTDTKKIEDLSVSSKILESYFGGGQGTQANPFVISEPVHYYNMVYLHEDDTMKMTEYGWTKTFAKQGLYFQFGENVGTNENPKYLFYNYNDNGELLDSGTPTATTLNMNYYDGGTGRGTQLIPLGTTAHPFIGHIIGNNLTVSNLHIKGEGYADIGIFGYVASGASIANCYFEKPIIDTTGADATADSAEAEPHTSHTYIGYIAGHATNANLFTHVYVNGAQIKNSSGSQYEMINSTGYFGRVEEPASQSATSSSYAFGMNAENAYNALDYANTDGYGKALTLRDVGYSTPTVNYENAVTKNASNTYTYDEASSGNPYSLSSLGYKQGDAAVKHVRFMNDQSGLPENPDEDTMICSSNNYSKPDEWPENIVPKYIYYEDGQWKYTIVSEADPSILKPIQYNCFTITYTSGNNVYYWKYNSSNSTLVLTSTAPQNASASERDYYNFVLRDINISTGAVDSKGIASLDEMSDDRMVYVYSPKVRKYMYTEAPNDLSNNVPINHHIPTFVDNYANATKFRIGSQHTKFTYLLNNTDTTNPGALCFVNSTTIGGHKNNGTCQGDWFTIGNPVSTSIEGYVYQKITNLSDLSTNDRVIVTSNDTNTSAVYAMGNSAQNNFLVAEVTPNNNEIVNVSGAFKMRLNITNGKYQFIDIFTDEYIANNGSGSGVRLKLSTTPVNWTITSFSGSFLIQNESSSNTSNRNWVLNGSSDVFACYPDSNVKYNSAWKSGYNGLSIYRRNTNTSTLTGLKSSSSQITYDGYGSDELIEDSHNLYVCDTNSNDPNDYELFTDMPSGETSFTLSNADSTVTTTNSYNYWTKVTSLTQMTNNGKYIIVSEANSVAMSQTQNLNNRGSVSVTASSGYIRDNSLDSSVQRFTGTTSNNLWTFATATGYLAAGSSSQASLVTNPNADANSTFSVSFSVSGNATITFQGSNTYNLLGFDASGSVFSSYAVSTGTVQIYKYVENAGGNITYVGDLIGGTYNPERIDIVGSASYYNGANGYYMTLNETCTVHTEANPNGTRVFHPTSEVTSSGIVLVIDKTGSNDLGSLAITYSHASDKPFFMDKNGNQVSFASAKARDADTNTGDTIHKDIINFSTTNISTLAYCGLNSSTGKITSITGGTTDKYVIILGAPSGVQISDIQFTFLSIPGNIGNFTSVDFRSATYTNGVFSGSQPSSPGIAIYYDITDPTLTIDVRTKYTGSTYTIYVVANKATTINVFLYDENATLVVNGVTYLATSNECSIAANFTPPSPWY